MELFQQVATIEEVRQFIQENELAFVYISREDCSVCHAVRPQVQAILENYPRIQSIQVDADQIPEVAGDFTVFSVPALLLFVDGKEMIREARFVNMENLDRQFKVIVENY
ncbi:thioredoxin family protein [Desemzia sp. RIT804]|uniref:thioredoxin family protein n=1 Tax=Desemzia sp. RIT 804 TaxID=2810209 RepID=UPI00194FD015|nr:thioredoxin family protein [Desemzia sp. RIT 804]MBM6614304.1 thioredoxin family protein [Desemzia sp. RIT 804]